jgi:hypothetical protein
MSRARPGDRYALDESNPWREVPVVPPHMSQVDRAHLTPQVVASAQLKLTCLPVPWIRDPRRAGALLLGLNPGWTAETEALEQGAYAEENRRGLTFESRVPMWNLDERLSGTPRHTWWSRRLRLLIESVGL